MNANNTNGYDAVQIKKAGKYPAFSYLEHTALVIYLSQIRSCHMMLYRRQWKQFRKN